MKLGPYARDYWTAAAVFTMLSALIVAGYFLGQIKFVSNNIDLILLLIVVISIVPMVIEWARHRREGRTQPQLHR